MKIVKGKVKDIRPEIAQDAAQQAQPQTPEAPVSGDPRDYTIEQLQTIVQQGQDAVQAHLTEIPVMLVNLANASQQLGSMRMLLAIKMDEEANDDVPA